MELRLVIIIIILGLLDLYFYQSIKTVLEYSSKAVLIRNIYVGFSVFSFALAGLGFIVPYQNWPGFLKVYLFAIVLIVFLSKLIGSVFILTDDIFRGMLWIINKVKIVTSTTTYPEEFKNSRSEFLSKAALIFASLPFFTLLYGMVKGAFDYNVKRLRINAPGLPTEFNGLKILQISDIHSGSFLTAGPLEKAFQIIKEQQADLIFFTGDLVNNLASETDHLIHVLKELKAPLGVYSVLGNHDYGDYVKWGSDEERKQNFSKLLSIHKECGWDLLMNENRIIERNNSKIAIIGVENWGASLRFPKYGKLNDALSGTERIPFKMLLSHDPSHWDAEVKGAQKEIALTFSGHTHGMQFGVEFAGIKWSPVKYFYKQWAGLYSSEDQHLYVNRGLGFIGYPGRVGILPEITVMELYSLPA